MTEVSIGICAYNEEENIGELLKRLLAQKLETDRIEEIIVVSSGSSDRTNDIVREFELKDKKIKLITQEKREGKASAINIFLKIAKGDILVMESADTLPKEDTIQKLIVPFSNREVGLITGHPIPINKKDDFVGFTVNLIWNLHHRLSIKHPKATEIVAFRNVIKEISKETAVDDLLIEAIIRELNLKSVYVEDAIVYNRGPTTLSDLIRQRKRIHIGYLHTKKVKNYVPITVDTSETFKSLISEINFTPREVIWTTLAIFLEIYVRCRAYFEFYILKRNPYAWEIVKTTKKL